MLPLDLHMFVVELLIGCIEVGAAEQLMRWIELEFVR
jgi:hypothetical protein